MSKRVERTEPSLAFRDRLREFVAKNTIKPGSKCQTCLLSRTYLDVIRQVRKEGATLTTISRFLASEGIAIRASALSYHFNEHEK